MTNESLLDDNLAINENYDLRYGTYASVYRNQNHAKHLKKHRKLCRSTEYKESPTVKSVIDQHIKTHELFQNMRRRG